MTEFAVSAIKHPFGVGGRWDAVAIEGASIQDIFDNIPDEFVKFTPRESLCALVNSQPVPRAMWPYVRPKTDGAIPVHVSIVPSVHGGDEGGKSIVAAVASIAILALTAFAASPLVIGGVFGLAAGTTAATLASAGIVAAGSVISALATSALSPPPAAEARSGFDNDTAGKELGSAFASGNQIAPGGAIPACVGRRKMFPPMACQPLVEIVGDDEVVEVLYCLNGPHDFDHIKVADVSIEDLTDVRNQSREGWDSDTPITLVSRYSSTDNANVKLVGHTCEADSADLETQSSPDASLPQWQRFITQKGADEIWIAANFSGFSDTEDPTNVMAVPIRVRARPRGSTQWKNFPEAHIAAKTYSVVRKQIKIIWTDEIPSIGTPPTINGPYVAFKETVGQDGIAVLPETDAWVAHELFNGGAGLTDTARTNLVSDRIDFYVTDDAFPRYAQYEIEIMRGYAHERDLLTASTYTYDTKIRDFFSYEEDGSASIAVSSNKTVSPLTVSRVSSIKNEHPVQRSGLALLALRGINVNIADVSIEAARYVQDWDGTEWATWSTTGNPAPHIRDVLTGTLTTPTKRTPLSEIDEAGLLAFRSYCETFTHEVAAIIDERSMAEVLTAIASSAYGRMKRSHNIGVSIDNDRSGDTFKQIFTPRDSRNFSWAKTFIEPTDGFRVQFTDAADDWNSAAEVIVYAEGVTADTASLLETVSYDTMTTRHKVIARAKFDLAQKEARSTLYTLEAPAKYLTCQRGDLVGVSNDMLIKQSGWARIKSITRNGSDEITAIGLDSTLELPDSVPAWGVTDAWAVSDAWAVGLKAYAHVQAYDGSVNSIGPVTGTGADPLFSNALALDTAIVNAAIEVGNLIVVGPSEEVFKRMIVLDIKPGKDLTATLTLVDEAPDLHLPADQYGSASVAMAMTASASPLNDEAGFTVIFTSSMTASGETAESGISATFTMEATAAPVVVVYGSADLPMSASMTADGLLSVTGAANAAMTMNVSADGILAVSGSGSAAMTMGATASGLLWQVASANAAFSMSVTANAVSQAAVWDTADAWSVTDAWNLGFED